MIPVDTILLLYAHVNSFPQHEKTRLWLDGHLGNTASGGLPWPGLLAFIRLVTNPRIFERPEPVDKAWKQVEDWLDCSPV